MSPRRRATKRQYEELLTFRTGGLRRFLRRSEEQAGAGGLTPAQHQLLVAIKGHPGKTAPTIGEPADYLVTKHHSVIELIDRAGEADLVERHRDETDQRVVRLSLTALGEEKVEKLTRLHLEELRNFPRSPEAGP